MKDIKFKKAIGAIRNIKMTSAEKKMVLERVMENAPVEISVPIETEVLLVSETIIYENTTKDARSAVKSPWNIHSFGAWVQSHRWISAAAVIVIVVLTGKSAVTASNSTLPGDTLYALKVNIVEPARVAFAGTTFEKVEVQTEILQARLQEAEILASRGQLDEAKEQDINQRVEKQVSELAMNIDAIKQISPEKADDISTTVEANINANKRLLSVIAIDRSEGRGSNLNEPIVAAVTTKKSVPVVKKDQSVTMLATSRSTKKYSENSTDAPATPSMMSAPSAPPAYTASTPAPVATSNNNTDVTSVTPPSVATSMSGSAPENVQTPAQTQNVSAVSSQEVVPASVESSTNQSSNNNNGAYLVKKASVQSLIQNTIANLDKATSTATTSVLQNTIANDARANLKQAQQKLQEADSYNNKGDDSQAYSALMDSERSTKEAALFIKAKVRLGEEGKNTKVQEEIRGTVDNGKRKSESK